MAFSGPCKACWSETAAPGIIPVRRGPAGVALEPVVAIVMSAPPPRQDAGRQVGGDEDRSPPLGLPHVGLLVVAQQVQVERVAAQDHVPQRHGVEADPPRPPCGEPAVELECSPPPLDLPSRGQGNGPGQQAQQRGRCRPGVAGQADEVTARWRRVHSARCRASAETWSPSGARAVVPGLSRHLMIHLCECGTIAHHDRSRLPRRPDLALPAEAAQPDRLPRTRSA